MDITWESVRQEAAKLPCDGWPAVQQAIRVGEMLLTLKEQTPYREFRTRAGDCGIKNDRVDRYMSYARNRVLLERHEPPSQRQALALIKQAKNGNAKPDKDDGEALVSPDSVVSQSETFTSLSVGLNNACLAFVNDTDTLVALARANADSTTVYSKDIPAPKTWWSGEPGETCKTVGIRFELVARPVWYDVDANGGTGFTAQATEETATFKEFYTGKVTNGVLYDAESINE